MAGGERLAEPPGADLDDLVEGLIIATMLHPTSGDPSAVMADVRAHTEHVHDLEDHPGRLAYLASPKSLTVLEDALERLAGAWWPHLEALLHASHDDVQRLRSAVVDRRIVTRMHDPGSIDGGRSVIVMTAAESSLADFSLRLSSWLAPPDEQAAIREVLDDIDADTPMARGREVLLESECDPELGLPFVDAAPPAPRRWGGRAAAIGAAVAIVVGLVMVLAGAGDSGDPVVRDATPASPALTGRTVVVPLDRVDDDATAEPSASTAASGESAAEPAITAPAAVDPPTTAAPTTIPPPAPPATSAPPASAPTTLPSAPRSIAPARPAPRGAVAARPAPPSTRVLPQVTVPAAVTVAPSVSEPPTTSTVPPVVSVAEVAAPGCTGASLPLPVVAMRATLTVDLLGRLHRVPTGAEIDRAVAAWQTANGVTSATASGTPVLCWRLGSTFRLPTDAELRTAGVAV